MCTARINFNVYTRAHINRAYPEGYARARALAAASREACSQLGRYGTARKELSEGEEERRGEKKETRVLRVQTKVSLQVAPRLQVPCTPYSSCISLPFSSFSRPFARPLYDFIFLLPMLHTAKVTSGRMSCCQVYKASLLLILLLLRAVQLRSSLPLSLPFSSRWPASLALRNRPIVALEKGTKVKGLRSNLKGTEWWLT